MPIDYGTASKLEIAQRLSREKVMVARKAKPKPCLLCPNRVNSDDAFYKPPTEKWGLHGTHAECVKRVLAQSKAETNGEIHDGEKLMKAEQAREHQEQSRFAEQLELEQLRGFRQGVEAMLSVLKES